MKRRITTFRALFLTLGFTLLMGMNSFSQIVNMQTVTVPPAPSSCTNTTIGMAMQINCINWVFDSLSFTVSNDTIFTGAYYTSQFICLGALSFPNHVQNLGFLPANNYTVIATGYENLISQSVVTVSMNVISCCNAASSFTASSTSICPGDTVDFTNTSSGQTSNSWYVNGVFTDTTTNFSHVFNSIGAQDVRLVVSGSGCLDSTSQAITVHSLPAVNIGLDTNYCTGSFVLLDAGSGWSQVNWSNGDTTRTTAVNAIGNYSANVQDGNGCWNSDTLSVSEIQSPVVNLGNDTTLCQGATLLLDATFPGGNYTWTDGSKGATFLVTQTGGYGVTVAVGHCSTFDTIFVSYTTCVGLASSLTDQVIVHPNPANEILIMDFENGIQEDLEFVLLDSRGTIVKSGIVLKDNESLTLGIADLASGIYILKVIGETESISSKIVIE